MVCDLCHYDAHIQAQLPVTDELRRLTDMELDLDAALRNLLEEERHRASGADDERKDELRSYIVDRESELTSDSLLQLFKNHIASLPYEGRPKSELEEYRLFPEWEGGLKQELASWKGELDRLESKVPDGRLIYNNARERVLKSLESAAQEGGLLPRREVPVPKRVAELSSPTLPDMRGWMSFTQLSEWGSIDPTGSSLVKPSCFRDPHENEVFLKSWANLFSQTAEWLIREGFLAKGHCPFIMGRSSKYLIHTEQVHANGRVFDSPRQLSNGLYIECNYSGKAIARMAGQLLAEFGQDPTQFHVQLG